MSRIRRSDSPTGLDNNNHSPTVDETVGRMENTNQLVNA